MNKKRKFKKMVLILLPLLFAYYVISGYFISEIYYYTSSKSVTTYIVYGAIIFVSFLIILFTVWSLICIKKNKLKNYLPFLIFLIIAIALEYFASYNLSKVSDSIKKVTENYTSYSTSLIVMKDSNINEISDLDNKKIGIIDDTDSIEGYTLAIKLIDKNKIDSKSLVSYHDYKDMLNDLYNNELSGVLISSSYADLYSSEEGFENIKSEVKEIKTEVKRVKKNSSLKNKTLTKPFSVLIVGVDSNTNSLKKSNSFNGDTLMLMTFNPNTMNATILSIPRDTRVLVSCGNYRAKNKINTSPMYGIDCVTKTVTNLTGIEIDYWVKVNFQGVVSLVNAVDGVEVDVPYSFCEQDSKRRFGKYTVYVEKGKQTLNGEQALAFARNRHPWPQYCGKKYSNYVSNDFIRGQNQQTIINGLVNKLKNVNNLSQVYDILEILGDNIDTNIDKETMMTGFDTFKNILTKSKDITSDDIMGTQKLYLSGYDHMIDSIYYFEYYKQSLEEITDAMEINLELKSPEMDKEFDFSINSPYESTQIGKGTYDY